MATERPEHPGRLSSRSWLGTFKRTAKEFSDDNLSDWAAALTYYAVLALFPGLIVLVALLGIAGQYPQTTNSVFQILHQAGASQQTIDTIRTPLEGVVRNKGGAGALLGVGLLGALWSASGYLGAFMRASNAIYEVREGRPFWKLRPLQVAVTAVMSLCIALLLVGIVVSGSLAGAISRQIGLGSTGQTVWSIAKWPVMAVIAMLLIAFLYYLAPNVKQPRFRWVSPGGLVAVTIWALATVGFFLYVKNFGSYNKTYGTLAGVIIFLVWLWISNIAILLGAEFNAELERGRLIEAGHPAEEEPFMEPRRAPKAART